MTVTVTDNFGFIGVYNAVPSTNDWACTYWNWLALDSILYGLVAHTHDGATALQNPTGTLSLNTAVSGGYLPANTTYYIAITYVDALGRQTAASDVAEVTTGAGISTPATPTIDDDATPTDIQYVASGLSGGDYWYKISFTKDGGESLASSPVYVQIPTDTTYQCTIHFPSINTLANGADSYYVYRKIGSTGSYVKLAEVTDKDAISFTDDNTDVPTCDKNPVVASTISAFHTITIDWSALDYTEAEDIKIYATTTSGTYPTNGLITTVEDVNGATPITEYTWTGTARTAGKPPEVTECFANPPKINLATEVQGELPWDNLPNDFNWLQPVDTAASLPITSTTGDAAVVKDEAKVYIWDGDSWEAISGIAIYDYPTYPDPSFVGEVYVREFPPGTYRIYITTGETTFEAVVTSGSLNSSSGFYGYYETEVSLQEEYPDYGYGAIAFVWENKSFYYYDDEIDTPAWIKQSEPIISQTSILDVEEDVTPTKEQIKINEILQALRASGLLQS
jgi:hypothetical protein